MKERTLQDFQPMQERCSNCSYCKFIPLDKIKSQKYANGCPSIAYYNFNTYSARGRFQVGLAVNKEEEIMSQDFAKVVHSCLLCGACDVSCKVCRYNLEPLAHNAALKASAVKAGQVLPGMAEAREKAIAACRPDKSAASWSDGLGLKKVPAQKAEILFFPGNYLYGEKNRELAAFSAKLLADKGLDIGVLEEEFQLGETLYAMGYADDFEEAAKQIIERFKQLGVSKVVTPCAESFYALNRLYPEFGSTVEVRHITQVLAELAEQGKLVFSNTVDLKVTYQDPCKLGRLGEAFIAWEGHEKKILNQVHTWEPRRPRFIGNEGVYDQPRAVINAIPGVKLVEMERIREYSWCCGGGGGVPVTLPDMAKFAAGDRMMEAKDTGADAIVTACAGCFGQLSQAAGDGMPQVIDILELVKRAL